MTAEHETQSMPNPAQPSANPQPVTRHVGEVISLMLRDLTMLCREHDAYREFTGDISAWFEKHPDLSDRFASFQAPRIAARSKARKAATAVNSKRRARR